MSNDLPYRDRVTIAQHEFVVVAIVLTGILDRRTATEADWQRVILALQRLRALA